MLIFRVDFYANLLNFYLIYNCTLCDIIYVIQIDYVDCRKEFNCMNADLIINEKCIGADLVHIDRADSSMLYNKLDFSGRMCALGFLMKFLERNESNMKDAYIVCSGEAEDIPVYYSEAVLIFEEFISRSIESLRDS